MSGNKIVLERIIWICVIILVSGSLHSTGVKAADSRRETIIAPTAQQIVLWELDLGESPIPKDGWELLMSEDFENTFPSPGWEAFDADGSTNSEYYWGSDGYLPHEGNFSAWCAKGGANGLDPDDNYYPPNMQSWMVYGPFDLTNYSAARLEFFYWIQSEPNYDVLTWQASVDGEQFFGSTSGSSVSGDSGGWKFAYFDLTQILTIGNLAGQPKVWIAITFQSDDTYTDNGSFIDDIGLWGLRSENGVTQAYLPMVLHNYP